MSNTYQHADGTECLWDVHDQAWYPMHPLYPMSRPCHQSHEPRCEGLAPFVCGNPSCPAHGSSVDCGSNADDWCLADNGIECARHDENGDRRA